ADGLRSRDMTEESLVEASIEASKDCDNRAYISWRPEPALELARAADQVRAAGGSTGPLMGIPVSVKDMFGVSGFPTYAGCARA
ncbi:2-amino-5-chloromuconate deaminase, partial [Enterococcus hirae]